MKKQLSIFTLLAVLLLSIAACGGERSTPESTPEPTSAPISADTPPPTAAAPVSLLPTPNAAPAANLEVNPSQDVPLLPGASLETGGTAETPASENPVAENTETATATTNSETAVLVPLEVDESMDCAIEPHIDLAGYPELEQRMGCPVDEAISEPVGINEFGPGPDYKQFMLWFSSEKRIYVLFADGSWRPFADTWQEGDPTFTCNPLDEEADSPPLPRRGFGKVWCTEPGLIDRLGMVEREERLCQHVVLQRFEGGRLLACFEDATIRYFRLLDDATWDIVVQ